MTQHTLQAEMSWTITFWFSFCFSDNHHDQKQYREGIISAYIVRLESLLEAIQGWDSSWNWRKSQREILLIGLVSGLCSDRLCIQHNPKFLRMVLTVDWASSHQSSTKRMFLIHAHKPIWPMQFFSWCFFLIGDSRLCQVDNKN